MLLSEKLSQQKKQPKIKTIHVKFVRNLTLSNDAVYEGKNGKVYVLSAGQWYSTTGKKPLIHNFIID